MDNQQTRAKAPDGKEQEETLSRDKMQALSMRVFRTQHRLAKLYLECRRYTGRAVWDHITDHIREAFLLCGNINTLIAIGEPTDLVFKRLEYLTQRINEMYETSRFYQTKKDQVNGK